MSIARARDPRTGRFYAPADPPVDLVLSGVVSRPAAPSPALTAALAERARMQATVGALLAEYPLRPLSRWVSGVTDADLAACDGQASLVVNDSWQMTYGTRPPLADWPTHCGRNICGHNERAA